MRITVADIILALRAQQDKIAELESSVGFLTEQNKGLSILLADREAKIAQLTNA